MALRKCESMTDGREQLYAWLDRDVHFAQVTLARNGANLDAWWPPLTAAEKAAALRKARARVEQWEAGRPTGVEVPLDRPSSALADLAQPIMTGSPPPGARHRHRKSFTEEESEPAPASEVEASAGIGRRALIVLSVVAIWLAIGALAVLAPRLFGVSPADVAVIAILALSALLAGVRGLAREIFSLVAWLGAAAAAYVGFPHLKPIVQQYLQHEFVAAVAAFLIIFSFTLALFLWFSDRVERWMHASVFNLGDRLLGLLFGLARGALLVCVIYLGLSAVWPRTNQPSWIANARARPYVETGVDYLRVGGHWLLEHAPKTWVDKFRLQVTGNNE